MGQVQMLVVEDDPDIARLLQIYFSGIGYQVDLAGRGLEALEKTRQLMPHLIILDILLPDIDGYEVCRTLRTHTRTSHIPVIFLTQKDERSHKIHGLELGADDYITKPFDIDELRLRVQNTIVRANRENLTDPRTGLPTGRRVEDYLRSLLGQSTWSLLDLRMHGFEAYRTAFGSLAEDYLLRKTAILLNEALAAANHNDDFTGYTGGDNFILVTYVAEPYTLARQLKAHFAAAVPELMINGQQIGNPIGRPSAPDLSLAISIVQAADGPYTDIRQVTERAAEKHHRDQSNPVNFKGDA